MSDEPYTFGPADPRAQAAPAGRPDPAPADAQAWGTAPQQPPAAGPSAGAPVAAPTATGPDGAPAPWGAQPPVAGRKRMSTMAKSLTAVGVAAVIAVGGTAAVTSANADNTSTAASSAGPMGGEGFGSGTGTGRASGGFGGGMASRSLLAGALHGEFVVAGGSGTVTERLQTGSLTAVSSSSVTVLSTDHFTATYVVPSGVDVSAFSTGTTVTVIAAVDGSTLTVVSISASGQGGTSPGSTGGFTPPDGAAPGGAVPGGAGAGGSSTGSPGNGPATGSVAQDSGV